jgi:hypothetical protein
VKLPVITFEKLKLWLEFALTCCSLIAIPVAGWWAYNNFTNEDTDEASPNITVSAEVLPYDADRRLLVVHVKPKNAGRVPVELDGGAKGDIDVFVKTFPAGLDSGRVNQDKLPVAFSARNIVSKYKGYDMEPGIDYDEVETFIVPKATTYLVYTEMDNFEEPDIEVDASTVVKVD